VREESALVLTHSGLLEPAHLLLGIAQVALPSIPVLVAKSSCKASRGCTLRLALVHPLADADSEDVLVFDSGVCVLRLGRILVLRSGTQVELGHGNYELIERLGVLHDLLTGARLAAAFIERLVLGSLFVVVV